MTYKFQISFPYFLIVVFLLTGYLAIFSGMYVCVCVCIYIYSARPKPKDGIVANGGASNSKKTFPTIDDVLKGLVERLCA